MNSRKIAAALVGCSFLLASCSQVSVAPAPTDTPAPTLTPRETEAPARTATPQPTATARPTQVDIREANQRTLEEATDHLLLRDSSWTIEPQISGPHGGGFYPEYPVSDFAVANAVWDGDRLQALFEVWYYHDPEDRWDFWTELTERLGIAAYPNAAPDGPQGVLLAMGYDCDQASNPDYSVLPEYNACVEHSVFGDEQPDFARYGVLVHVAAFGPIKEIALNDAIELTRAILGNIGAVAWK